LSKKPEYAKLFSSYYELEVLQSKMEYERIGQEKKDAFWKTDSTQKMVPIARVDQDASFYSL
jgi:hypothetical protein